jgi:hypothetical protein
MEEVVAIMAEYFDELEAFTNGGEDEGTEGQEEESD